MVLRIRCDVIFSIRRLILLGLQVASDVSISKWRPTNWASHGPSASLGKNAGTYHVGPKS